MEMINTRFPIHWLLGFGLLALLLYLISPVLTPFLMALFIAYISNPAVSRLERVGVARWVSMLIGTLVIMLIIGIVSLLFLPALKDQVSSYLDGVPGYVEQLRKWAEPFIAKIQSLIADVSDTEKKDSESVAALAKEAMPVGADAGEKTVDLVKASTAILINTVTNLFLIPVISFYLIRDWNSIVANLKRVLPASRRDYVLKLTAEVDEVLKSFLSGQVLVMISLGTMYFIGLLLIGLQFSLLIGVIAGILSFVPFLGTAVGLLMASMVMIAQADSVLELWKVVAVFSVGQFIEGNFLTPKLVGEKINLHPVVVIFAVLAGGQLFGFMGILLGLPVAAVAWVVIKNLAEDSAEEPVVVVD